MPNRFNRHVQLLIRKKKKTTTNPLTWRSFDLKKCYEIIHFFLKLCLANGNLSFNKTNTYHVIVKQQENVFIVS